MPRQNYKIPIPIPEKEREREKKEEKRKEKKAKCFIGLHFLYSHGRRSAFACFPITPLPTFFISYFIVCLLVITISNLSSFIFLLFFFLIFLFTVPIKLLCQCPSQSLIMINNQNASPFRKSNSLFNHFIFPLFSHPQNDTIYLQHLL